MVMFTVYVYEWIFLAEEYGSQINHDMLSAITQQFNSSLRFDPSLPKMAYAIRDPVPHGLFQVNRTRGFCDR